MTPAKTLFPCPRRPRLAVTGGEDRTTPSAAGFRSELVVIDPRVADAQFLLRDLISQAGDRRFDVVTLSTGADGFRQIAKLLRGRAGLDAIHIISHGDRDGLWLGAGHVGAGGAGAATDLSLRSTSEFGRAVEAVAPGFVVTPTAGLATSEAGGKAAFSVTLRSPARNRPAARGPRPAPPRAAADASRTVLRNP